VNHIWMRVKIGFMNDRKFPHRFLTTLTFWFFYILFTWAFGARLWGY